MLFIKSLNFYRIMDEEIFHKIELHVAAITNTLTWLRLSVAYLENIMVNGNSAEFPYFHDALEQLEDLLDFFQ